MRNLLQKLIQKKKKPILTEATLEDRDLVTLSRNFDMFFLVRDGRIYRIGEYFLEIIDHPNPRVTLKYYFDADKEILKGFKTYRELRN